MYFVAAIFSLLFFNYYAKTLKNFNLEHSYSLYIEKTRLFIYLDYYRNAAPCFLYITCFYGRFSYIIFLTRRFCT